MPLFHRDSLDEKQGKEAAQAAAELDARLQERSIQSLAAGGLPARAQERVEHIRASLGAGASVPLFGSDLSVSEFLLARQMGYDPVGLAAGACVFQVGWNAWTATGELEAQTGAMSSAGTVAIDRLRQEAQGMDALGVVGVHLEIRRPAWAEQMVEVVALGTAIRARDGGSEKDTFVCGLSAQEYCALLRTGARPCGLAFGNSTYYIYTNWMDARQNMSWYNQEVVLYTQAVYEAQRLAFGRLREQARAWHAHGIVGVHVDRSLRRISRGGGDDQSQERSDYVTEYLTWGTAILIAPGAAAIARPSMVLDLEDLGRMSRETPGAR